MPYYTHAGELPIGNVIHMTLSEEKQIITETQIQQCFMDCLQIADQELEATSLSLPMFRLRNFSNTRVAKIVLNSLKTYIQKAKRHSH